MNFYQIEFIYSLACLVSTIQHIISLVIYSKLILTIFKRWFKLSSQLEFNQDFRIQKNKRALIPTPALLARLASVQTNQYTALLYLYSLKLV